jgi:protein TonB
MRRLTLLLGGLVFCAAAPAQEYQPKFARDSAPNAMLGAPVCRPPAYPRASLRNEETGVTVLRFIVKATGHVEQVRIIRTSGFRDLDQAAIDAFSRCLFVPAAINGKPIQSTNTIQYVWTLE